MSSLAAACADGYYQPELKAQRNRQLNKSKRRPDGGVIVRMAIPRNGKCTLCNALVPGGERFNAIKRSISVDGEDAFRFEFTCKSCRGKLFMSTDPKHAAFVFEAPLAEMKSYVAEKKRQEEEEVKPAGVELPLERLEKKRDEVAFFSSNLLSADADGQRQKALRDKMRRERRAKAAMVEEGRARGLNLPMLPAHEADRTRDSFVAAPRLQPRLVLLGASHGGTMSEVELVVKKRRRRDQDV